MYHPVKEKNMHELAKYRRELWSRPVVRFLFFELTDQCNLNCLHCGSNCSGNNHTYLEYDVICKVMRSVAEKYDPPRIMICLTGGEPMLHPDIFKIVAMAHELGFSVGLTSNGTLIDTNAARKLAISGLDTIAISLDGIEDSHDEFRQSAGSFDRAMQGVHSLRSAGIEPQALTVIHKNNIHQLEDMFNFFRNADFYSWRVVNMEPIGRARENSDLILKHSELIHLLNFIREKRFDNDNKMDVTYGCSHYLTYEYEREVRDFYFQCGAGTQVASVMANGDIGACLDIERKADLIQGNAYNDDFVDIWENRFQEFRIDRTGKSAVCADCEHIGLCMGDSAHTWDYENNRPGYCIKVWKGDQYGTAFERYR